VFALAWKKVRDQERPLSCQVCVRKSEYAKRVFEALPHSNETNPDWLKEQIAFWCGLRGKRLKKTHLKFMRSSDKLRAVSKDMA